jgi:hypothetical protein
VAYLLRTKAVSQKECVSLYSRTFGGIDREYSGIKIK